MNIVEAQLLQLMFQRMFSLRDIAKNHTHDLSIETYKDIDKAFKENEEADNDIRERYMRGGEISV